MNILLILLKKEIYQKEIIANPPSPFNAGGVSLKQYMTYIFKLLEDIIDISV